MTHCVLRLWSMKETTLQPSSKVVPPTASFLASPTSRSTSSIAANRRPSRSSKMRASRSRPCSITASSSWRRPPHRYFGSRASSASASTRARPKRLAMQSVCSPGAVKSARDTTKAATDLAHVAGNGIVGSTTQRALSYFFLPAFFSPQPLLSSWARLFLRLCFELSEEQIRGASERGWIRAHRLHRRPR